MINTPILDNYYFYNKIIKKDEEELNIYEKFYLWSFKNRTKIIIMLSVLLIIIYFLNMYDISSISKMTGGDESGNSTGTNNTSTAPPATAAKTNNTVAATKKPATTTTTTQPASAPTSSSSNNTATSSLKGSISSFVASYLKEEIDAFFISIIKFLLKKKISRYIALIILIYSFGLIFIPLILLFYMIKYSIKIYKKKTSGLQKIFANKKSKKV